MKLRKHWLGRRKKNNDSQLGYYDLRNLLCMAKNIFEDPTNVRDKNCNIKNKTSNMVIAKTYIQTEVISARSDKVLFSIAVTIY